MQAEIIRKELVDALKNTKKIAKTSSFGILCEAKENHFYITTTNEYSRLSIELQAIVRAEGSVVVPYKTFCDIINAMNSDKIDFSCIRQVVTIKNTSTSITIPGSASANFPELFDLGITKSKFAISPIDFKNALDQISFAMSEDSLRPILTGMLWEYQNGTLRILSTDGFRVASLDMPLQATFDFRVIIPHTTIEILSGIIKKNKNNIGAVAIYDRYILVSINNMILWTKLLDGKYPDINQYIPKQYNTEIQFQSDRLLPLIKQAASILGKYSYVSLQPLDHKDIVLYGQSKDKNVVFKETFSVDSIFGQNIEKISYNTQYLLDSLVFMGNSPIIMRILNRNSPCIITSQKDSSKWLLLMPVWINN